MNNFPIGIIDSGSGGLSIWKEITALLPNESTLYVGDHAYLPYSEKSTTFIRHRVAKLIQFLLAKHVKLIVVACNTATVAGIDWYRVQFPATPILGVVPVVKTAAAMTRTNEICILSTKYTASSRYQKKLIKEFASHISVVSIGSSRLVEYIESAGDMKEKIRSELQKVLKPLCTSAVDVVVLGCTHFPFIKKEIQNIVGTEVTLLDSGLAVARHVQRILDKNDLFTHNPSVSHVFYSTGDVKKVSATYQKLLKRPAVVLAAAIA
jgi:glutamate racemase